jgi:hypothetical protein
MLVAERFMLDIVEEYGKHSVSTDGATGIRKHVNS